jgi:2-C-methyl-D-erythritol 4-phosphate cytidylyltransferase/2-C-methyl-D-erythritol 2,4-cyclodiphosphate synthase
MEDLRYSAVIVAAGRGERAGGGQPKQFRPLAGTPMLVWSVKAFLEDPSCEEIVIAVAPGGDALAARTLGPYAEHCRLVHGGGTRTQSVRNAVFEAKAPHVLIHDAARPLLTGRVIKACLAALTHAPGAAPALPVADALARGGDNGVEAVDRSGLFRIQTPQAFRTADLRTAFLEIPEDFPDEVSLARSAGLDVALVPGDERNFKVTWPEDFERAEAMITQTGAQALTVTGMGYDVHRLIPGDGVHLCGVFIACDLHLVGHSDADAGLHAITDALLGAAGLGDIGDHFPPSDDQWKGADSAQFLLHALDLARAQGVRPVHCDVTLICERPKIGPHKSAMKAKVANLLGLAERRVNIKATTTEKLGFTGRGEGLAAEAIITCQVEGATS